MNRDRDRILEQALKHELRAAGTPPAGACLDAETLGAWTDGGLDPAAMAATEAHISNCARCQALVGAMARGGTLSTPGTLGTSGTPGTLSLWKWWLAPLAAGVTAVTLWMVIPEQQQIATAPPVATVERERTGAFPPSGIAQGSVPGSGVASDKAAPGAAADRLQRDNQVAEAPREDRQRQGFADQRKEKDEESARKVQERAALADAPAAPAAPVTAASPVVPVPGALAETVTVAPSAMPAEDALRKNARSGFSPNVIEIPTLDPARGWRIAGDRIERSDDEGRTWRVMRQSPDGLTAGSAPSNPVCWFVGRGGRVLLTVDAGATFADVSLAEPLDLASVAATDARNASIYSVVGRRFRTADGGRTWRPF